MNEATPPRKLRLIRTLLIYRSIPFFSKKEEQEIGFKIRAWKDFPKAGQGDSKKWSSSTKNSCGMQFKISN